VQGDRKTALGHVRVSSDEQVEGLSIETQMEKISECWSARGHELRGFFGDEAKSAYNDDISKRPQFEKLLNELPLLRPDIVIVLSLD
jgi:DNA invertase Pin-like site-specific DNA recombinase